MSDYIKREDALNECETLTPIDAGILKRRMRAIQGIDIVRCRECKWWIGNLTEDDADEAYGECCFDWDVKMPKADDYCSMGERCE